MPLEFSNQIFGRFAVGGVVLVSELETPKTCRNLPQILK